ncbi:hypothetical protein Tco_1212381 [Tanacetum coccineum]
MVVHNQEEMGEGSGIPTDPHHTATFIQQSPQSQKTQKPRRPKKKDTRVPQSSVPSDNVADEAIYKELDDSLVRAATTASSLEVEQDSGNISKTRSKATPNEAGSQGTASGNSLQSGEDSLKLQELMALCTTLQTRVLDLEQTKTTQAEEIVSLKRRVKKLEQKKRSRTHKLKRLYKVGLTATVESSGDEEDLTGEEVFVAEQSGNVVEEVVVVIDAAIKAASTIPVSAATTTTTVITNDEITLAKALAELKSAKLPIKTAATTITVVSTRPRAKGLVIHKQEQALTPTVSSQQPSQLNVQDTAQQIEEVNIAWDDVQARVEDDYQLAQRLQAQEQEELTDEEKANQD